MSHPGQKSQIDYARRKWLVESGRACWYRRMVSPADLLKNAGLEGLKDGKLISTSQE